MQRTREQLGLDQDPKVLRLPEGLEVVRHHWFADSGIEKLIISNTVKKLGDEAFSDCVRLCEVVFEPGSQLETIGNWCFSCSGIEQIVIPKNVQSIENGVFYGCKGLRSLTFEDGSQLTHVGMNVLVSTPLEQESGLFPSTARVGTE